MPQPTQIDRIEELLVKLVDAHPQMDESRVHKADVAAMVIGMISDMAAGRQIEAIKAYRHLTGYGLKESKDAIVAVRDAFEGRRKSA